MKRSNELVRDILIRLEERTDIWPAHASKILIFGDKWSLDQVCYHIGLMVDSGLIDAKESGDKSGPEWWAVRMTSAGHDFLDNIRSPGTWSKLIAKVGDAALPVMVEMAMDMAKKAFGLGAP